VMALMMAHDELLLSAGCCVVWPHVVYAPIGKKTLGSGLCQVWGEYVGSSCGGADAEDRLE
jgi:hypothetical protein